jgi:hypothetical protein
LVDNARAAADNTEDFIADGDCAMPRSLKLEKYDQIMLDIMDNVGKGGKPVRFRFDTVSQACGKRSSYYTLQQALEHAMEKAESPAEKAMMKARLKGWWQVKLKVVVPGTEEAVVLGPQTRGHPADLLIIHSSQTKESKAMAEALRLSMENEPEREEARSGLPSDRTVEAITGEIDIASMVAGVVEEGADTMPELEEQDPVTGNKKMSNGEVWNRFNVAIGRWK